MMYRCKMVLSVVVVAVLDLLLTVPAFAQPTCTCDAHCDDLNPCTEDKCCGGVCTNEFLPGGFHCDDNDPCTVNDACTPTGGVCAGTPVDCSHLDDDCNVGACSPLDGACFATPINESEPCNIELFCTQGAACVLGVCTGGTPNVCDDGDPCTTDFCNEDADICVGATIPGCCENDAECDDGVFCNGPEPCNPTLLVCEPGTPPDGQPCDDGLFCTEGETCTGGVCGGGSPLSCDDGDPCTTDECDEEGGGCYSDRIEPCCETNEDCDDDNPCTGDICNAANQCENPPLSTGAPCGDQGTTSCSDPDACNGAGMCQANHTNEGEPCDDADACTDNDMCMNGVCTGTPNGLCEACAQGADPGDPTSEISFQAKLVGVAGGRLGDPTVDLEFQFYDAAGLPVGSSIPVNGVPCIDWGDGHCGVATDIPVMETLFGDAVLLGVSVNGTPELTPRITVGTVPQAFRVGCATGDELSDHLFLGGSETTGELRLFTGGPGGRDGRGVGGMEYGSITPTTCGGKLTLQTIPTEIRALAHTTVELKACAGPGGYMALSNPDGVETVKLLGGSRSDGAQLELRNDSGYNTIVLDGDRGNGGLMYMTGRGEWGGEGNITTVLLDAQDTGGGGAVLWLANRYQMGTIELDADESGTSVIRLFNGSQETDNLLSIQLHADNAHHAGQISMFNEDGKETVELIAAEGYIDDGAQLKLRKTNGTTTVILDAETATGGGALFLEDKDGRRTVEIVAAEGESDNGGQIKLRKADGTPTIWLDAEYGPLGPGRITTQVLKITGGSDLSEQFDVDGPDGTVKPGMLVSIDPQRPGKLVISDRAYDRRVAGIISGAGGVMPGMLMAQSGSAADGEYPVALTGRVYCLADASDGPIQPGDLLTTSATAGHAMKVRDHTRAQGAIIGKAMTALEEGKGLVLVLVTLQ